MAITKEEAHFVPVADQDDLERLFAASTGEPIVLFKHEYGCPISSHAYGQLAAVAGEIQLIDVERQKGLARDVTERTGITHESPQVIIVRDGQPVFSASHWDISQEDITRAIHDAEAGAAPRRDTESSDG